MNEEYNSQIPQENTEKMPDEVTIETDGPVPITNGPILVLLATLLLAVLAGMFYWFMSLESEEVVNTAEYTRPTADENNEPESTTAEAQADAMGVMSTSDDINAIEADLESTDLNSLDTEMQTIENEINSAE